MTVAQSRVLAVRFLAHKGTHARVRAHVFLESAFLCSRVPTSRVLAREGAFIRVREYAVSLEVTAAYTCEAAPDDVTDVRTFTRVDTRVASEVTAVARRVVTALRVAHERPHVSVNPHV